MTKLVYLWFTLPDLFNHHLARWPRPVFQCFPLKPLVSALLPTTTFTNLIYYSSPKGSAVLSPPPHSKHYSPALSPFCPNHMFGLPSLKDGCGNGVWVQLHVYCSWRGGGVGSGIVHVSAERGKGFIVPWLKRCFSKTWLLMGKRVSMNGGWSHLGGLTEPSMMSTTAHLGKMKMAEHPTRHHTRETRGEDPDLHYCSVNKVSWPKLKWS
jgi:hypothetical protein